MVPTDILARQHITGIEPLARAAGLRAGRGIELGIDDSLGRKTRTQIEVGVGFGRHSGHDEELFVFIEQAEAPFVVNTTVEEVVRQQTDLGLLTGESDPVEKAMGDQVLSGSFVAAGSGLYRATRVGADSGETSRALCA